MSINDTECQIRPLKYIILPDVYNGIPQTVILNMIVWTTLILLFSALRKIAWKSVKRTSVKRASLGEIDETNILTQLFYGSASSRDAAAADQSSPPCDHLAAPTATSPPSTTSNRGGFFSWIFVTLRLSKEQIEMHSGPDAVHYLSFQRRLIVVMAIITFMSLVVILPVNMQGTRYVDSEVSFGKTTISNLRQESNLLWTHVIVAIVYVPMVVLIINSSSGRYAFKTVPSRTVMVTNISPKDCQKTALTDLLRLVLPSIRITNIEFAYNIAKLTKVWNDYQKTIDARIYCEMRRNYLIPVKVFPSFWSCRPIDGYEFYLNRENQLKKYVVELRAAALNDPLGIAFITVATPTEALNVVQHFRQPISTPTNCGWTMTYAPTPSDILWENLNLSSWYDLKWAFINCALFLLLFFLTTPIYLVNLLNTWSTMNDILPQLSEFLPTLLLWTLTAIFPTLVTFTEKILLSHRSHSKENTSIMTKSFGFLLFMVLILPSLGLTSASTFLQWLLQYSKDNAFRWECISLSDNGSFFVNYMITSAFIGTALDLIRFGDLALYAWKMFSAGSRAEKPHIRKTIVIRFPFGYQYAWTVMLFTMSTVYSVISPLVTPFAMVYILLKHFSDRHNLYFAYGPIDMSSQGGGRIHSTAIKMTRFSVLLVLIVLAGFTSLGNSAAFNGHTIVALLALVVTTVIFLFMSNFNQCRAVKRDSSSIVDPVDDKLAAPTYVANVLQVDLPADEGHQ